MSFNPPTLNYSPQLRSILAQLGKACPKPSKNARKYARTIGVSGNVACVCDGYALLVFHPEPHYALGPDVTLDCETLDPVDIPFPNWRTVVKPGQDGETVTVPTDIINHLIKQTRPGKGITLTLIERNKKLVIQDFEKKAPRQFNINLFLQMSKGLPKKIICTNASVNDSFMLLDFTSYYGLYQILLLSLSTKE